MISLFDKVPDYLLGKYQLLATVTFAALFSLFFLFASIPYVHNPWFELELSDAVSYSVIFYLIAIGILSLSRKLMYDSRSRAEMLFHHYLMWNVGEVVIISALYAALTYEGSVAGLVTTDQPVSQIFLNALVYCILSLGIPYLVAGMYFAIQDKDNTIRMINYGSVVSDEDLPLHEEQKITLFDNNGVLKLSVNASNLYYIESDDNYIKVWYMDSRGALKQYMLRCRLKTVEDSFRDSNLVRCHRKYIVNLSRVRILTKEKDGYMLDLGLEGLEPIPISKTYEENVLASFNSR